MVSNSKWTMQIKNRGKAMLKIKNILCDIIKTAYGPDCNPAYFKFYIEIADRTAKSMYGYYKPKEKKIVVLNTYRDDEDVLHTVLHELAHHIDYCNRKTSDHQKLFYDIYKKLLYAAMDMEIIHKDILLNVNSKASDYNKVKKIVSQYVPHLKSYKKELWLVSIGNAYKYKDYLKEKGYHYNKNTTTWEKEVLDYDAEHKSLKALPGATINFSKATDLHFNGAIKLIAQGDTYPVKDKLKEIGFKYENQKWIYYAENEKEANIIIKTFPKLKFNQR